MVAEDPPCCFPQGLHQFTLPPTVPRGALFPHPHQQPFVGFLDASHPGRRELLVTRWSSQLHVEVTHAASALFS